MDIYDEELFDVRPSCSTSTSLNVTATRDLMQDPIQEKDSNSILIKDISVKLTRLRSVKEKTTLKSIKCKRRNRWRYGLLNGKFSKKKKSNVPSSKSSNSQQAFRNAKPVTEVISSEDRGNKQIDTHLHNQLYQGELYEDAQQNEQRISNVAQNKTENFNLSTCETEKKDLCVNVTYACARTLPYKFYRKNIPSSSSAIDYCDSSSSSKDTESSLHSNQSNLTSPLSKDKKVMKKLIRLRLKLMAKKVEKRLNKWKFKRKSACSDKHSSDSETEKQRVPNKKRRRIVLMEESDSENETVNNTTAIENNNQSESHLSFKKIDARKTCIQFSSPAKVILTKLEEMEDEDVIKWRKSKISDISSESIEQLDQRKLSQNLVASHSQDKLILPTEDDKFLEINKKTQNISKDSPLTIRCIDRRVVRSKLKKLRKKHKLFKKPRVLLIKLDTLQYFPKDDRYSATEVEYLTKKYLNFVINSKICKSTFRKLTTYKHMCLQSRLDANTTCTEDQGVSSSLSKEQSMNESLKSCFIDTNSIKGTTFSSK